MKLADYFPPGKITNPIKGKISHTKLHFQKVKVEVPARLNAMVFDTTSLTGPQKKFVYTAGELLFAVKLYTNAFVEIDTTSMGKIIIHNSSHRVAIIRHTALIMKKAIKFKHSIRIHAYNTFDYVHCGFGSSAALQYSVAIAINTIFGNPISQDDLICYLAQNYGEEVKNDPNKLIHVQSNGGMGAAAFYGGVSALAGESAIIFNKKIPTTFRIVIGIPRSYERLDAVTLMRKEEALFNQMKKSAKTSAQQIAWNVVHQLLPALVRDDYWGVGNVIDEYRFKSGSIETDGLMWPEMLKSIIKLRKLRKKLGMQILSSSSCGPAIFSLTMNVKEVQAAFKNAGLDTFLLTPDNDGAIITASG